MNQHPEWIWHDGQLKPYMEAQTHVMTHALHYGTSVFEGVRCYSSHLGAVIFRLRAHTRRMYNSAKIYRLTIPFTPDEVNSACHQVIAGNRLFDGAYIRPIAFRGAGDLRILPSDKVPVHVAVAAWQWGSYLGGTDEGVDVCCTSWQRVAPNTIPALAKAGGNYLSSVLVTLEAQQNGYVEGLAMTHDGLVSEGAGENIFVAVAGKLYTPPYSASILPGITRDTVIKLAGTLGIPVIQEALPREVLYIADELFLAGTAAEITPVRSLDRLTIGSGKPGELTRALQDAFFGLFDGRTPDPRGWLEPVEGIESEA